MPNYSVTNFLKKLPKIVWGRGQGVDFIPTLKIDEDAHLGLIEKEYDDLQVPLTQATVTAGAPPTFATFKTNGAGSTGVKAYSFGFAAENELYFVTQLPHGYKEGTDLHPHLHWSPSSAAAGNVTWGLEYTVVSPTGTFGNTSLMTITVPTEGVASKHQISSFSVISGTDLVISSLLICRLYRSTSGNTYSAAAFALDFDFHYEIDSIGSKQLFKKDFDQL